MLTGRNGSGKSHLLTGIKEGSIFVRDTPAKNILYLTFSNFVQNFQVTTDYSHKVNAWNRFIDTNNLNIPNILRNLESRIEPYKEIIESSSKDKHKPYLKLNISDLPPESGELVIRELSKYKDELMDIFNQDNYKNDEILQSILESVIFKSEMFASSIKHNYFFLLFQKTALGSSQILSDLSTIFNEYHRNINRNFLVSKNGGSTLDSDEFVNKYGKPPWDLIRNIFSGFNLPFDINDPSSENVDPFDGTFQIKFFNTERNNKEIVFGDLSSGEQILITLINAIYTATRKDNLPKLILLDEIDGPLNPSIIQKFINYITENFVENGIKVIVATHSPSTVAFSQSDSIFAVDSTKTPPITQKDHSQAISLLSDGFTTLSDLLVVNTVLTNRIVISEGKNY
ncbi:MAG: AAA family ATPase [Microgenomates group bacterium]